MARKTTKTAPKPSLLEKTLRLEPFAGLERAEAIERYNRERWTLTKRVRAYNAIFGTSFKPSEVLYRKYQYGSALSPEQKAIFSLPTTGVKKSPSGELMPTAGQLRAMGTWARTAKIKFHQFLIDTGLMVEADMAEAKGDLEFFKFMSWVKDKANELRQKTPSERAQFYANPDYDGYDDDEDAPDEDDDDLPM